jgi:hypothetical protein
MEPIQPPAKSSHIVVVGLCMFALLVITVSLGGGCSQAPSPRSQTTTTPTPTPTPKDSPRADTPIIVKGGGSIDLDFEDGVFSGTPPACTGCSISRVALQQIKDTGNPIDPPVDPVPCDFTGDPTIKIETRGSIDDVTVQGTSNTVQITYPAANYTGVISECGDEKKRHSTDGKITAVKVNGTPCTGCTNWKRCKVMITVRL